jgi:hypothetical protein
MSNRGILIQCIFERGEGAITEFTRITVWDQESKFLTREESYTRQHLFVQVAESNGLLQNMSLRCDRYTNLQKTQQVGRVACTSAARSEGGFKLPARPPK